MEQPIKYAIILLHSYRSHCTYRNDAMDRLVFCQRLVLFVADSCHCNSLTQYAKRWGRRCGWFAREEESFVASLGIIIVVNYALSWNNCFLRLNRLQCCHPQKKRRDDETATGHDEGGSIAVEMLVVPCTIWKLTILLLCCLLGKQRCECQIWECLERCGVVV